jgi:hypothetical protein
VVVVVEVGVGEMTLIGSKDVDADRYTVLIEVIHWIDLILSAEGFSGAPLGWTNDNWVLVKEVDAEAMVSVEVISTNTVDVSPGSEVDMVTVSFAEGKDIFAIRL